MNVVRRPDWTVEQFLAWEERQPTRYEFDGTHVVDMNGATIRHQLICENLFFSLRQELRGKPCRAILPTRVRTATTVRYPDVGVTCSSQVGSRREVVDPVILFEVISESTAATDLTNKVAEYTALPSLRQYVLLSQTEPCALSYVKTGGTWAFSTKRSDSLDLPAIAFALALRDVHADVTFED